MVGEDRDNDGKPKYTQGSTSAISFPMVHAAFVGRMTTDILPPSLK
jgi:hypothetical protein